MDIFYKNGWDEKTSALYLGGCQMYCCTLNPLVEMFLLYQVFFLQDKERSWEEGNDWTDANDDNDDNDANGPKTTIMKPNCRRMDELAAQGGLNSRYGQHP